MTLPFVSPTPSLGLESAVFSFGSEIATVPVSLFGSKLAQAKLVSGAQTGVPDAPSHCSLIQDGSVTEVTNPDEL